MPSTNASTYLNCRPVRALEQALANNRLPHAILLHSEHFPAAAAVAHHLAQRLLATEHPVHQHPDYFARRPANKMRQIGVEPIRQLIDSIQQTPSQDQGKVAVIYHADRLNVTAANTFLKTLEEPPADTTILLLTSYPNKLLPTIRSRCFIFSIPAGPVRLEHNQWTQWQERYQAWLAALILKKSSMADLTIQLYGLVTIFEQTLKTLSQEAWQQQAQDHPEHLPEEEKVALEIGAYKETRQQLFREIAWQTRTFVLDNQSDSNNTTMALAIVIEDLERAGQLTEVNFNELAALESFLLASLETWQRG